MAETEVERIAKQFYYSPKAPEIVAVESIGEFAQAVAEKIRAEKAPVLKGRISQRNAVKNAEIEAMAQLLLREAGKEG